MNEAPLVECSQVTTDGVDRHAQVGCGIICHDSPLPGHAVQKPALTVGGEWTFGNGLHDNAR